MRKVRLLITSLILFCSTTLMVNAYETVLVDFPPKEVWKAVLHQQQNSEAILQYVPKGQSSQNWTRTLIFHSYKKNGLFNFSDAKQLINTLTAQLEYQNNSAEYRYVKYDGADSIAVRCVNGNSYVPTQCEILRTTMSYEGIMSMHYINKDTKSFKSEYPKWLYIVRHIKIYRSYFRDNRVMDKELNYEI